MDISIVIVNYNVKHFVDQCLRSVREAINDLDVELLLVDNDSVDGSVDHIRREFPEVTLIANKKNVGFAKANNQAIRMATGKYILLLNPDTIIEKETLTKCFAYMESHADVGALGVRMIDGEGKFLPESKRGFPTPTASLMRLTALSRIFPRSKFFNKYNLGYLSEHETHEIDVLCGAFMFMKKKALDEVGLLDEAFFMYGEDIDLSYRIQSGGYKIIYFPESSIVHFKGESTKKSSLKYYNTFYTAMAIFAKKHYGGNGINPFLWMINAAIFLVGFSNFILRYLKSLFLPIAELLLFYFSLQAFEYLWARFHFHDPGYYDAFESKPLYIVYSLIWVLGLWLSGSYRSKLNIKRLVSGVVSATLLILILYALMDNSLRHSRAIILMSSFIIIFISLGIRYLNSLIFKVGKQALGSDQISRVLVVGDQNAINKAKEIIAGTHSQKEFIGALSTDEKEVDGKVFIQHLSRIEQVIEVFSVTEVFFSQECVAMNDIMQWMTKLGSRVRIKIISRDVQSIIGSHDRNTKGDLYTVELNYRINLSYNVYLKWIIDYVVAFIAMILSPLILIFSMRFDVYKNIFQVLLRKKTWVSYYQEDEKLASLPSILPGIIPPFKPKKEQRLNQEEMHRINFYYARDFSAIRELEILLLNLRSAFGGIR